MKKYLGFALALTVSASSFAFEANSFTCVTPGSDGSQINYDTTSKTGKPLFSVDNRGIHKGFTGDQITSVETSIGKEVTVTLQAIPDFKVTTATLILPTVNLSKNLLQVTFQSQLVYTTSKTSIGGPALVNGVVDTNQFVPVKCVARETQS